MNKKLIGGGIFLLIFIISLIFFLRKGKDDPLEDEEPIEETIEEPIEETIEEPIEETIEEPIEETIEEPIEETIEEPIEEEEEILKNPDEPVQPISMADEETPDKKAADKKAADKKAADKAAADKKAADKAAADKKAADKKALILSFKKAAADKKEADKKAADKKEADKNALILSFKKAAADKKAADKKEADKNALILSFKKAAADKKAADKKAADKKAADKKALILSFKKAAADKKAADKKAADKKAADKKALILSFKKAASSKKVADIKAANKSPPTGAGPYLYPPTGITYQVSSAWDNGKQQHFTPWINSKQGWSSAANNTAQWFNMKFKKQFVKNLRIQGRVGGAHGQYLISYNLYYKNEDNHWIFKGRKMTYSKGDVIQVNPVNETTHEIQLNIVSWKNHITFRADLEFGGNKPKSLTWLKDGGEIRFASVHKDKFIRGFENATVGSGGAGSEEIFICKKITGVRGGKWAFFNKSHKRFLRANSKKDMDLSGARKDFNDLPAKWEWEAFVVMDAGDGYVGLLTHHHYYVGLSDKNDAYQGQPWKDIEKEKWMTWERFIIRPVRIPISKKIPKHILKKLYGRRM
jgi:hypothetical protein